MGQVRTCSIYSIKKGVWNERPNKIKDIVKRVKQTD